MQPAVICPECHGTGELWPDQEGTALVCHVCGGEGEIDPPNEPEAREDFDPVPA